jgi:hypothetical protein
VPVRPVLRARRLIDCCYNHCAHGRKSAASHLFSGKADAGIPLVLGKPEFAHVERALQSVTGTCRRAAGPPLTMTSNARAARRIQGRSFIDWQELTARWQE